MIVVICFAFLPNCRSQGVIQCIFEVGNCFWAHKNQHPNFDKLTKNKVSNKHRVNHKLPPMYIKHCKPVF